MLLKDWIDTLEALPADAEVVFDFGASPAKLCSWRGIYAQLTLMYDDVGKAATVAGLLVDARAADGKTYTGYKGGDYVMSLDTPVWADDYGDCNYRGLIGTRIDDGKVVLITADLSDYRVMW